jgi:hypothetical protein
MLKAQDLVIVAAFTLVGDIIGCSSDKSPGGTPVGSGGAGNGTGGSVATTGGSSMGGTSETRLGSGGTYGTVSSLAGTGGVQHGTGGTLGTNGTATGGSTGGASTATGTGGSTGGASTATGGAVTTGGASTATGGAVTTGGVSTATGGVVATGGAGAGGATAVDPTVSAAIEACMSKLPYGATDLSAAQRAPIITAIINTCAEFAPPGAEWQTYCQMFLVAAINAESSYDTQAGTQGASGDPSVGLLQIRFSSVVRDFADYGPINALTRIGCNFGTVTSSDSYATKSAMMLDVNCNVAIATWYYFIFASGNGGSSVVWVDQYCSGEGVAGNLHIGIASFLMGGDAAHTSLSGADFYYNEIKGWFDPCVTYTGTHPFELSIQPNVKKYCG